MELKHRIHTAQQLATLAINRTLEKEQS